MHHEHEAHVDFHLAENRPACSMEAHPHLQPPCRDKPGMLKWVQGLAGEQRRQRAVGVAVTQVLAAETVAEALLVPS